MPQTVCDLRRAALSRPLFMLLVALMAKLGCAVQHKSATFSGCSEESQVIFRVKIFADQRISPSGQSYGN